MVENGLLIFY